LCGDLDSTGFERFIRRTGVCLVGDKRGATRLHTGSDDFMTHEITEASTKPTEMRFSSGIIVFGTKNLNLNTTL
jgi:hypothetical protein